MTERPPQDEPPGQESHKESPQEQVSVSESVSVDDGSVKQDTPPAAELHHDSNDEEPHPKADLPETDKDQIIADLQKEKNDLKSQIQQLQTRHQELEAAADEGQKYKELYTKQSNELLTLASANQKTEEDKHNLQSEVERLSAALTDMTGMNQQLTEALQKLSHDFDETSTNLALEKNKTSQCLALLDKLKSNTEDQEIKDAIESIGAVPLPDNQKELLDARSELRGLKSKVEQLENSLQKKEEELNSVRQRNQTQIDSESSKPEIEQLKRIIIEDKQTNADLLMEITWYRKAICLLEKQLPKEFDFENFYERLTHEESTEIESENAIAVVKRGIDAERQTKPVTEIPPAVPVKGYVDVETSPIHDLEKERNRKVGEITKKYELMRKERDEMKKLVTLFKAERESSTYQIETLKSQVEELQEPHSRTHIPEIPVADGSDSSASVGRKSLIDSTAEMANKRKKKNLVVSPTKKSQPMKGKSHIKEEDSSVSVSLVIETKAVSVQATPIQPILEISRENWYAETPKLNLSMCRWEDAVVIPSKEQQEVFRAKQNALKRDYDALQKQIVEKEKLCREAEDRLAQNEEVVRGLNETISRLEDEMKQQRTAFQEKLLEYKNGADQYIKTVLTQSREIERAKIAKDPPAMAREEKLEKVAERIRILNEEKERLEEDLSNAEEMSRLLERQNKQLMMRIKAMEDERHQTEERITGAQRQQSLQKYSSQMRTKYNELKSKYSELETQYNELKRTKTARFDPLMMSRIMTRSAERESSAGDPEIAAKLKQTEITAGQLKVRNDELQSLLARANATIERLNQLLARKETQLTHFHEQISQLKHELMLRQ